MYSYRFLDDSTKCISYKKNRNIKLWGTANFPDIILENNIEEINFNLFGGSFAIAADFSNFVVLVCDYICSIPLFYSIKDKKIYASTNALLIGKNADIPLDKENVQEFLYTGFVTQERTVFKDIYQVMPGQFVKIYKANGNIVCKNYFNLEYGFSSRLAETQLVEKYDKVLFDIFEQLVKRLDGRTALVPLSGGCDSRTVAVMLKRLEYKNVICFSYGRKGSYDVENSEKTAKALGFKWHCVEYNAKVWKKFYDSEDYPAFLKFSVRGGMGCVQALPAVLELKRRGVLPKDSVVVPGHAQDFISGSHIGQYKEGIYNADMLASYIIKNHYHLSKNGKKLFTPKWLCNIPQQMDLYGYVSIYQKWEWINRQAKFIANDVRAYEFAGYLWEMPFWDKTNLEFWMQMPINLLYGRKLQYIHMEKKIDKIAGLDISYPVQNIGINSTGYNIKKFVKKVLPLLVDIKIYYKKMEDYEKNINAFYSFMKKDEFKKNLVKYGTGFSINTLVAEDTIDILKRDVYGNEKR